VPSLGRRRGASPGRLTGGFHLAMIVCAGLLVVSSLLAVTMTDDRVLRDDAEPGRARWHPRVGARASG
jgi:hypothetical protein